MKMDNKWPCLTTISKYFLMGEVKKKEQAPT
jgi:hypothetical protein